MARPFLLHGRATIVRFAAQGGVQALCAPSAFISTVTESSPIRTSHPSGSRRWGFPWWGRHPAPGCLQPQKFLGSLPWSSASRRCSLAPLGSNGRCLSITGERQPLPCAGTDRWLLPGDRSKSIRTISLHFAGSENYGGVFGRLQAAAEGLAEGLQRAVAVASTEEKMEMGYAGRS